MISNGAFGPVQTLLEMSFMQFTVKKMEIIKNKVTMWNYILKAQS